MAIGDSLGKETVREADRLLDEDIPQWIALLDKTVRALLDGYTVKVTFERKEPK